MKKVLVVGGGPSGSLLCYMLRNTPVKVTCWDKARGFGGRAATKRGKTPGAQGDTGLQYLTRYQATPIHTEIYQRLLADAVIHPFDISQIHNSRPDSKKYDHYVATEGASQLAKYFLHKSGAETITNRKIQNITLANGKAVCKSEKGHEEDFDMVFVTIPVPQFLQDVAISPAIESGLHNALAKIEYSTRYVLVCFYDKEISVDCSNNNSVAGYHYEGALRYWSVDNRKRGKSGVSSLIFHSNTFLDPSMTKEESLPILLNEMRSSFPGIPEPTEAIPHKWKYSQTRKSMDNTPGFTFINEKVALFGDGFVKQANFDGCIESAHLLSQHVLTRICPK